MHYKTKQFMATYKNGKINYNVWMAKLKLKKKCFCKDPIL